MKHLTFDDVLIEPAFSDIASRKDVDLTSFGLKLPVLAANMDTIVGPQMIRAMKASGGSAVLHRFCSIEDNVKVVTDSGCTTFASIGLDEVELARARALFNADVWRFVIDVAHGAQLAVVEQVKALRWEYGSEVHITVGNFASPGSVRGFLASCHGVPMVDAIKVGVGPGSACLTRVKTGVGVPQLSAIVRVRTAAYEFSDQISIIADGGMRTPGDIAKAFAAGADAVMLGGMLAGTDETPGETIVTERGVFKKYRGSASQESYEAQGKQGSHRTAEGDSFLVPAKGPVADVLADIEGGLRSAFTYVGARNMKEFHEKAKLIEVSSSTVVENGAHGKRRG